ncbi:MAG TPA: hypothetical protein VFK86_18635 [Bauldia sp.]|nr:hypothetical protein [Bauldia sp.]
MKLYGNISHFRRGRPGKRQSSALTHAAKVSQAGDPAMPGLSELPDDDPNISDEAWITIGRQGCLQS